jgi:hypothetical protein
MTGLNRLEEFELELRQDFVARLAGVIRAEFPGRRGVWNANLAVSDYSTQQQRDQAAIVDFNDHRDTSFDDVELVLGKVAVL